MVSSGGYWTEPRMINNKQYLFHSIHRAKSEARSTAISLREKKHNAAVVDTNHGWHVVYWREKPTMVSKTRYSGSEYPSSRRSGSKGRKHKDIVSLKRAAKRGEASKSDTRGYGWPGGQRRNKWKAALRRDNSGKMSDKARAGHLKRDGKK